MFTQLTQTRFYNVGRTFSRSRDNVFFNVLRTWICRLPFVSSERFQETLRFRSRDVHKTFDPTLHRNITSTFLSNVVIMFFFNVLRTWICRLPFACSERFQETLRFRSRNVLRTFDPTLRARFYLTLWKCFFLMFCEPEFVDSHLRVPNVSRKRYDSVLRMFIKRLTQPYIGTLRARFWRTLLFSFLNVEIIAICSKLRTLSQRLTAMWHLNVHETSS